MAVAIASVVKSCSSTQHHNHIKIDIKGTPLYRVYMFWPLIPWDLYTGRWGSQVAMHTLVQSLTKHTGVEPRKVRDWIVTLKIHSWRVADSYLEKDREQESHTSNNTDSSPRMWNEIISQAPPSITFIHPRGSLGTRLALMLQYLFSDLLSIL